MSGDKRMFPTQTLLGQLYSYKANGAQLTQCPDFLRIADTMAYLSSHGMDSSTALRLPVQGMCSLPNPHRSVQGTSSVVHLSAGRACGILAVATFFIR